MNRVHYFLLFGAVFSVVRTRELLRGPGAFFSLGLAAHEGYLVSDEREEMLRFCPAVACVAGTEETGVLR